MNARRVPLLFFTVVGIVSIPVVCFKYLTPPYFWIGCGYLIIALGLLLFVTSTRSKVVLVNLVAIIATVTGFEGYLYANRPYKQGRIEHVYDDKYFIYHPDLGYTLGANLIRPNATEYLDNKLIYKVSYSTNEYGLRRSMSGDRAKGYFGCILFYGGSFTYGEGLNDEETLPWRVDVLTGRQHRVYNFGLHGYGPHQMLASLENGHTESIVDCKDEPVVVIYTAIIDHIKRAAGLTSWDKHGPRYQVDSHGKAVLAGHFDETLTRGRLFHLLDESYIFKSLLGSNRGLRKEDFDLFLAIVEKARARSIELFHLQDFVVIYWDAGPQDPLPGMLSNHNIRVFRVNDIITGSRSNDSGLKTWDTRGPRYRVDDQGKAVLSGHFDETITRGWLFHLLDESYIFRSVLGADRALGKEDYDLFLAVVEKARARSAELFDLQDFVVIYWDAGPQDPLPGLLSNHNIRVFRVNDIIPGSRSNDSEYRLPGDLHPSALADEKLAEFIVKQGLVPQRKTDPQQ